MIADSHGYEMTFTRHTIDNQKNHITLYYFSNKELDNLKELNVKLSQQLRLTVSFLADMDYILSYAQDLCQRKEIGIEIVDYSYEPETRKCVLSYVPNIDINNSNEITGIIGRTYHCVAKLRPIEKLITV